jgi:hypothetical protein
MPAEANLELLMNLSADIMITILSNTAVDPSSPGIPELAFSHASKLLNLNLSLAERVAAQQKLNSFPLH